MARKQLGAAGERIAARYYEAAGYEILATNWSIRDREHLGEIDLILSQNDPDPVIVFCEVKTRRGDRFGSGLEAVTPAKQRQVRLLASTWLRTEAPRHRGLLRFDVAAIDVSTTPISFTVVPNAF